MEAKWTAKFFEVCTHDRRVPSFETSILLTEPMLPDDEYFISSPLGKPRKPPAPRAKGKPKPKGGGRGGGRRGRGRGAHMELDGDSPPEPEVASDEGDGGDSDERDEAIEDAAEGGEDFDEDDPMRMDDIKQLEDLVAFR